MPRNWVFNFCIRDKWQVPKGALKKIIDTNIALQTWLTRGMIKNLLQKKRAKKKIAEDLRLAKNNVEIITCPRNIVKSNLTRHVDVNNVAALGPIKCSPGRSKGTTDVELMERKLKFEQMKDDIVLGWVDKTKRPSMQLQGWILMKQQEYGFDPKNLTSASDKKMYSVKKSSCTAEWKEIHYFHQELERRHH